MPNKIVTGIRTYLGLVFGVNERELTMDDLPRPAQDPSGTYYGPFTLNQNGVITAAEGPTTSPAPWAGASAGITRLFTHVATADADTVETDLYSDTLAAGQLAADDDVIEAVYGGDDDFVIANHRIRLYFGGTLFWDTGDYTPENDNPWGITARIVRVDSSTVRTSVQMTLSKGLKDMNIAYASEITGLTLANTNVLKITGETSGSLGDLNATMGFVNYLPA